MLRGMPKVFLISGILFCFSQPVFAAYSSPEAAAKSQQNIESRLSVMEENQKKILEKQDEILERINGLKAFIRRY